MLSAPKPVGKPLTLATLADTKSLTVAFLRELGVDDEPGRGVRIAYHDGAGDHLYDKIRHKLDRDDAPQGKPLFSMPRRQHVSRKRGTKAG